MKTIYKYQVDIAAGGETFDIPDGGRIVLVDTQYGHPSSVQFWVEVDPNASTVERKFRVVGTGHQYREAERYVGTAIVADGRLVWHLLEEVRS